jgi:hypothetical protein
MLLSRAMMKVLNSIAGVCVVRLLDLVWICDIFEGHSRKIYDNGYCSVLLFPGAQRISSIVRTKHNFGDIVLLLSGVNIQIAKQ